MAVRHDRSFSARLQGIVIGGLFAGLRALPIDWASALGGAIIGAIGPLTKAQRVARTGLHLAFPDITPKEEARILRGMWDSLGRVAGEFPNLPRIARAPDRIVLEGAEQLAEIRESNTGAVFVSGHFSNWEIMPMVISREGLSCQMTYRPINNGFVDDIVASTRRAYGSTAQAAKGMEGGMHLMRALKRGECVAIMNDQKYNEGVEVPFFGSPVMAADGPARLAQRFGAPIVPMTVTRLKGARFRVNVHPFIRVPDLEDKEQAVAETVAAITRFVEDQVRALPEQWFWVHRRWPSELYRGKAARAAMTAAEAVASKSSND